MKQKQCQHIKEDLTKCTSFAMNGSEYCYRHNPDIPDENKINASSRGGKGNEFIETPLPEMKMNNLRDVANVLADSINRVRTRKISQKTGSTIAYMSFVLYMIMQKAKEEEKNDEIIKQKADGTFRPEPVYNPKTYNYKDRYYLDKDGNELIVENNGTNIWNPTNFQIESDCGPFVPVKTKHKKKQNFPPLDRGRLGGVNHECIRRNGSRNVALEQLNLSGHPAICSAGDENSTSLPEGEGSDREEMKTAKDIGLVDTS